MKSCFDICTGLLERVLQKYKFIECQLAKNCLLISKIGMLSTCCN